MKDRKKPLKREAREAPRHGPRRAAAGVLGRVYGQGAYADITLSGVIDDLRPEDRGLATELVYGVLRRSITIDAIIEGISTVKIKKMETAVLMALRIGVYQIFFLSRVPDRAAVDESVRLVRGSQKKGFVNAVLRKAAAEREKLALPGRDVDRITCLSIRGSHPKWMVSRWLSRYGEAGTEALLEANLATPRRTLRVNTLRVSVEDLLSKLKDLGVRAHACAHSPYAVDIESGALPPSLRGRGLFVAQDEASQIVPMLLSPLPGETILDACAAPGMKTTHMAEMMRNKGTIMAVDKYAGRLRALKDLARDLGITIIRPLLADSTKPGFLKMAPAPLFDAILVDAPCSGLGVLARTPDIKLHRKESDISELAKTQKSLLKNLLPLLRPGGRLVYSVCTLEPEETDDVVEFFLRKHDEVYLEDAATLLPENCRGLVDKEGCLRTLPHRDNMDGFFAARFIKKKRA